MQPLNLLYYYYTNVSPNPRVLELCGAPAIDTPYSASRDEDLTVIINAYARPEYLPLIWEAVQYQSRRPRETWIIQNHPGRKAAIPRAFLNHVRDRDGTVVIDSGLNHGCWYRFLLAALSCRTRYVAVYDDDTLSGRLALETALDELARTPGLYGAHGITFNSEPRGPRYWSHESSGWPAGTPAVTEVDFVGQLWVMETYWLKTLFQYLPERLLMAADPARECGEDMYLSFVAQKSGLRTYVLPHGPTCNPQWSSLQAYEMGRHANAMSMSGGLGPVDEYLDLFVRQGWKLLRYLSDREE